MSISHELAHIVLHSLDHNLKKSEEATDITAMMLGFSKFFEIGHTVIREKHYKKNGYLSFEELIEILNIIDP